MTPVTLTVGGAVYGMARLLLLSPMNVQAQCPKEI